MTNTLELEKRWYRYKAKQIGSGLIVGSLVVLSASSGVYYSYNQYLNEKRELRIQQTLNYAHNDFLKIKSSEEKKRVKEVEVVKKSEKRDLFLDAIIPVIDMEKEERKHIASVSRKKNHRTVRKHAVKKHVAKVKKQRAVVKVKKQKAVVKVKPSQSLSKSELKTVNSTDLDSRKIKKINMTMSRANYIDTIEKKFNRTKKPREALLLAKAYYSKRNYAKAEEWALRANKLDSNLEESWFLFAKSKAKLGKKREALKILVSYFKKSRSAKARLLIEKIKTGRL